MYTLGPQLNLDRCPHCNIDQPSLVMVSELQTVNYQSTDPRHWRIYKCVRCGGIVSAAARAADQTVQEIYPEASDIDDDLPERAREYLKQAKNSLHSPAGAVMLAASAVDAMLKEKTYKEGSLYARIDKAAADNVITADMAKWAHEVRLDANEQRHVDEDVALPSTNDAQRSIDFVVALGQFMFVLPARVQRGLTKPVPTDGQ